MVRRWRLIGLRSRPYTPPFQVTDLGSTNGTFVNGEKIAAHTPTPLLHGSVVSFGPPQVRHAWGG